MTQGGIIGLFAAACSRLVRRIGFQPLILGLGWLGVEAVAGFLAALWPSLGFCGVVNAQNENSGWLAQSFGYLIVSFLVSFGNAVLLVVVSGIRLRWKSRLRSLPARVRNSVYFSDLELSKRLFCFTSLHPRAPPVSA